jgi:hypothetical protein
MQIRHNQPWRKFRRNGDSLSLTFHQWSIIRILYHHKATHTYSKSNKILTMHWHAKGFEYRVPSSTGGQQ